MTYKLTDKKPTKSGYYWVQKTENNDPIIVRFYYYEHSESNVYLVGYDQSFSMDIFKLWSERIEEPVND